MISVVKRKLITSDESFFTSAPITPSDVRRRYSKGRDLEVVLRKGYRKSGMCAIWSAQFLKSEEIQTYRSERAHGSRCAKLHIEVRLERCILGSKPPL